MYMDIVERSTLHFRATQPLENMKVGGGLTADQLPQQISPTVHERRKPARHSRHQDWRPWRDPDLHPRDIHFKHKEIAGLQSSSSRYGTHKQTLKHSH